MHAHPAVQWLEQNSLFTLVFHSSSESFLIFSLSFTNSIGNTEVKLLFKRCNWIIDQGTKESISLIRCRSVFRRTCTLNFSTVSHVNGINSVCDSMLAFLKQLVTPTPPTYSVTIAAPDSASVLYIIHISPTQSQFRPIDFISNWRLVSQTHKSSRKCLRLCFVSVVPRHGDLCC